MPPTQDDSEHRNWRNADEPDEPQPPVEIPYGRLSAETLDAVIEEFVTRDGTELTDAGRKIEQVRKLLDRGELIIMYDPNEQSVNMISRR